MAKYKEATEEVKDLVAEISSELGLEPYGIDFEPLFVKKSKEICKVVRANELAEKVSKREDLVFVICNEGAFDETDPQGHPYADNKTKYLWLRTEMEKVSYDTEKCKIIIGCPSITLPVGLLEKFMGEENGKDKLLINNALAGQHTLAKIEQDRKEEEARRKALKTKKKKNQE